MTRIRGRCALCRCKAVDTLYSFKVCLYHLRHGEDDPPCPFCHRSLFFDPRWTYTVNGEKPPEKIQVRQSRLSNTIFFDNPTEACVEVVTVKEPSHGGWPTKFRNSVVMIGIGQQVGTEFVITQWASDWERELFEAARPSLALASRIFDTSRFNYNVKVLAGSWRAEQEPYWPTVDVQIKTVPRLRTILGQQLIRSFLTREESSDALLPNWWMKPENRVITATELEARRNVVWRANYARVLDSARQVFQIEWPMEDDNAQD